MVSRLLPNPWAPLIEQDPDLAFSTFAPSRLDRPGLSPSFLDFVRRQRVPAFQAFQGALGRQILQGEDPTLSFSAFLQDSFPFRRLFEGLDPRERGETPARFAPRLRFNL